MGNKKVALTEEDIQAAREILKEQFFKTSTSKTTTTKVEQYETHLVLKFLDGTKIEGMNELKIKTVFHAIEENVKDQYGGVLDCTYNVRNTIDGLYKWISDKYPPTTVGVIQEYANNKKITFDAAKKELAFTIAYKEWWIRILMARFLHDQLKPTLEMLLTDLVNDAALYGLSEYGAKLVHPQDFDKFVRHYLKLRKKRTNIIRHVGERGKSALSGREINEFKKNTIAQMAGLELAGRKINPHAVARKLIVNTHTNPLKAFKDMLKKYRLTFEELEQEYLARKKEQKNR